MNLLALIPLPYRWLMLAGAVAATFGYGYFRGYEARDESADAYEAKVEARADYARERLLEVKARQDQTTRETGDAHRKDVSRIHAYYARRLRELPAGGKPGSAAPERARLDDGATPEPASCGQGAERDLTFERACALDAAALNWWQEFARRNNFPIQGDQQ